MAPTLLPALPLLKQSETPKLMEGARVLHTQEMMFAEEDLLVVLRLLCLLSFTQVRATAAGHASMRICAQGVWSIGCSLQATAMYRGVCITAHGGSSCFV